MLVKIRSLPRPWGVVTLAFGLLLAGFCLDAEVAHIFAQPIHSGQAKAILTSLRAWGEATTVVIVLLAIATARPKDARNCVAIGIATLFVALTVSALKPLTGRLRPEQVAERGLVGPWHFGEGSNSSFPSGHVATAFAFASGLAASYPAIRPICLLAACGTAASRMHERRHYLSDCIAGALLGWYLAAGLLALRSRLPVMAWRTRWRGVDAVVLAETALSTKRPSAKIPRRL